MNTLKNQLANLGFQQTPQKEKKLSVGHWKKEVREKLLKTDNIQRELRIIIKKTHDHFKAEEGSGKWFRKFLRPLYKLRDKLEDDGNPVSVRDRKKLIKKLW